jgi:DNA-binding MarR family transcriptional regulator
MPARTYKAPATISRDEFLVDGSDRDFRRSIYALVQCVGRLLACRDAFGKELDLTPSQFAVLMGVAHSQGSDGITIRELSEHVALASTHVTTEVGRLERAGLLTKRPSKTDRRSVCVSLTRQGEEEIARVTPFIRRINDVLFRDIDATSLAVAYRVARQLIINSEGALAEVRRHNLQAASAGDVFGTGEPTLTSRAASNRYRAASRSAGMNEDVGSGRRKKAAERLRSG